MMTRSQAKVLLAIRIVLTDVLWCPRHPVWRMSCIDKCREVLQHVDMPVRYYNDSVLADHMPTRLFRALI